MTAKFEYPSWLRVDPANFRLADVDPNHRLDSEGQRLKRKEAQRMHEANVEALDKLQFLMHAEGKRSLLVAFQAIDSGGKDGAIRRVFGPLNPQGVRVRSFKVPSSLERAHDFLWRVHHVTPRRGEIKIYNRSHYEDVLVVRVKDLVPEPVWRKRYTHINNFEDLLNDNDTLVLKFLLHISKDEQRERLQERLDNPDRHWKFSKADLVERKAWDAYQEAFEEAVIKTSTERAPWYVIPANRKWFRNYAISTIVRQTLEAQHMSFPQAEQDLEGLVVT
ncbi:MAG: PPK2 family polyphosphate kinase [Bradymonadaceae bacterium]